MKVLSLFSGIGAFEKALARLRTPYYLVGFSEIDKYATKSYCAIHGVDESPVPCSQSYATHALVECRTLPGNVTYSINGIRRIRTMSAILRIRADTHNEQC